jgi:DNA-binding GntR family transcriptional regulator
MSQSPEPSAARVSLVDNTELALRNWLEHGAHRTGDRLPPELELASMLGVSRGTLRTALERLEATGEIVRRQGSGTFVGRLAAPTAFDEGLETLVTYSRLARGRGIELTVQGLTLAREPLQPRPAELLGLEPGTEAMAVERVVLADGEPAALMRDVIHPDVPLPPDDALQRAFARGDMVLDVLLDQHVTVGHARTRVTARLITGDDHAGKAFGVRGPTAVLELEEVMYLTSGEAIQWSCDIFTPGGLELHVRRALEGASPLPIINQRSAAGRGGGSAA